jgi:hypothetical protein
MSGMGGKNLYVTSWGYVDWRTGQPDVRLWAVSGRDDEPLFIIGWPGVLSVNDAFDRVGEILSALKEFRDGG